MPRTSYAKKTWPYIPENVIWKRPWISTAGLAKGGTLTECPASLRHFCVLPYSCMTKIPMHACKYVNLIQLKCNAYVYTRVSKDMDLQFAYPLFQEKNHWDYEPCLPHKCTAWFLGCAKTRNQCTNVIIYKAAWIGIDRHIRKDPMDPHMNTDRYITVCIQIIIFWRWRSR